MCTKGCSALLFVREHVREAVKLGMKRQKKRKKKRLLLLSGHHEAPQMQHQVVFHHDTWCGCYVQRSLCSWHLRLIWCSRMLFSYCKSVSSGQMAWSWVRLDKTNKQKNNNKENFCFTAGDSGHHLSLNLWSFINPKTDLFLPDTWCWINVRVIYIYICSFTFCYQSGQFVFSGGLDDKHQLWLMKINALKKLKHVVWVMCSWQTSVCTLPKIICEVQDLHSLKWNHLSCRVSDIIVHIARLNCHLSYVNIFSWSQEYSRIKELVKHKI